MRSPLIRAGLAAVFVFTFAATSTLHAQTGTADQAVKDVLNGLADGKPVVLWQALPASYQKDVKALVADAADKVDPEVYDKGFAVARKAVKLLKDKKDFILQGDFAKALPATIDAKKLGDGYDAVVGIADTVVNSELGKLDELKKADVEKMLTGTGAKLYKQLASLDQFVDKSKFRGDAKSITELPAMLRGVKVTVVKAGPTETTLKMEAPDAKQPDEQVFVKVEGKWVPKKMADDWAKDIKSAKDGLAQAGPVLSKEGKQQALAVLGMADQAIDKLAATKTADEFNKAIQDIVGGLSK